MCNVFKKNLDLSQNASIKKKKDEAMTAGIYGVKSGNNLLRRSVEKPDTQRRPHPVISAFIP